jgi:hypothetical protein
MTPWGSKETKAQKEADKVISKHKKEIYVRGYIEGVRYARNQVIEFLNAHHDLGDIMTHDEVITELEYWKIHEGLLRGLADGQVAPIYSMDKCEEVCQDCFGSDLCLVCERADRR